MMFVCKNGSTINLVGCRRGVRWSHVAEIDSGLDCRHRVTKLREGSEILFQIRAQNKTGMGEASPPSDLVLIEEPATEIAVLEIQCQAALPCRPGHRTGTAFGIGSNFGGRLAQKP